MKKIYKGISLATALWLIVLLFVPVLFVQKAEAANFAEVYVRFDRLRASTATTGMVCANPGTTRNDNVDLQVTFPDENSATDFTVGASSSWEGATNISTSNIPAGAVAWPGITAATVTVSGQTVTWTYAANQTLNNGTLYCFRWTDGAALNTSSAGINLEGIVKTRRAAGVEIDSSKYATAIITNDQIVVTAVVPPLFYFTLSGNTDSFTSDLTIANVVSTTGRNVEVRTNAANGWISWVRSANAGLNSVSTGASIATAGTVNGSPSDLNPTTGYVLDANVNAQGGGTGTMVIDGEYDGTTVEEGGTLSTTFQPVASANGTTDGDIFTVIERAFISSTQPAATDYTDTLTIVAAGRF